MNPTLIVVALALLAGGGKSKSPPPKGGGTVTPGKAYTWQRVPAGPPKSVKIAKGTRVRISSTATQKQTELLFQSFATLDPSPGDWPSDDPNQVAPGANPASVGHVEGVLKWDSVITPMLANYVVWMADGTGGTLDIPPQTSPTGPAGPPQVNPPANTTGPTGPTVSPPTGPTVSPTGPDWPQSVPANVAALVWPDDWQPHPAPIPPAVVTRAQDLLSSGLRWSGPPQTAPEGKRRLEFVGGEWVMFSAAQWPLPDGTPGPAMVVAFVPK